MAGYLYDITGAYTITYYVLIAALIATATMFWLVSPRKLTCCRHESDKPAKSCFTMRA